MDGSKDPHRLRQWLFRRLPPARAAARISEKLKMNFRGIVASKISQKVLDKLIPGIWPGTAGALFERSLNVEMKGNFLIHIGSDALPLTPRSILLREEDFYKHLLPVCFPGQPVFIEDGSISLGQKKVDLFHPRSRHYDPQLNLTGRLLAPDEVSSHLARALHRIESPREKMGESYFSPFRSYFLSRISTIGKPGFGRLAGPSRLKGETDLAVRMKNALWQKTDRFLSAMSRQDGKEALGSAQGLIGLGPGLTPSGDDFLAGFFSAGAVLGARSGGAEEMPGAASIVAATVREEAAGRPTSVSAAMLADALQGEVSEPVKGFLYSVLQAGDGREIRFWAGEISRMGAFSGEDLLNGLASGILFFRRISGS